MERDQIDAALAGRLVADQFPAWAHLPVVEVESSGWDNRTFRLGRTMAVRMPSAEGYAGAVGKEHTWLPRLAPALPLPIPLPVALGRPSPIYPWPWSIRRWLPGVPAGRDRAGADVARQLADFLTALQRIDPAGGPLAGPQNSFRGGDLGVYDAETRRAVGRLGPRVDAAGALDVWEAARNAAWSGTPVWVHGDVAAGNLLLDDGRLSAVIDFGTCGIGDPACDLVIAWTLFDRDARAAFREAVSAPADMWARARGWALWKALITAVGSGDGVIAADALWVVDLVIAEHRQRAG